MNWRTQIMNWRTDHEAGLNFVDCYLDGVHAGEMDPTHIMCSVEAWYLLWICELSQHVNAHSTVA
jgi:hypothetical protein